MRIRPMFRSVARTTLAFLVLGIAGCSDGLFFPGAEQGPTGVHVVLPSMSVLATGADADLQGAFARVDRVQVTVTPEGSETPIASELVEVGNASGDIRISLPVSLDGPELPVLVRLELRAGALPLFRAESRVVLTRGENPSIDLTPSPVPGGIVVGEAPAPFASIGDTAPVTASVTFPTGEVISGLAVSWSSRDPQVASVSPGGTVTAVGEGSTTLEARYGDLVGELGISVQLQAVSLSIEPSPLLLIEGDTRSAALVARDARNNTFTPGAATWTSANTQVASVDAAGNVSGVLPGQTTLRARVGTLETEAPVRVRERISEIVVTAPVTELDLLQIVTLTAVVTDIRGATVTPPGVTWSSSDPNVATVGPTGRVEPKGPGETLITAERDGVSGSLLITVVRRPSSIEITPSSAILLLEERVSFSATVLDAAGIPFSDAEVSWRSSDPNVVVVDASTGTAEGVGIGTAQVIAEWEGLVEAAPVVVGTGPPNLYGMQLELAAGSSAGSLWGYFQSVVQPEGIPGFVRFTLRDGPDAPSILVRDEPFPGTDSFEYVETPPINLGELVSLPGEYTLRAQAFNELGASMAIDSTVVLLPPPVIVGAQYTSEPDQGILVTWTYPIASDPEVYFEVQVFDDGFWFSIGSSSSLEFIDPEAGPESTVYYRVRACAWETYSCSPFSAAVIYTPSQETWRLRP